MHKNITSVKFWVDIFWDNSACVSYSSHYKCFMQLLAATYENIWPFQGVLQTVFFRRGAHLIQAPIGSGKSFLFFDGPLYGLYKYSQRNMTNVQSKTSMITILFSLNDQIYLVERKLKAGKSKDSCTSTLWTVWQSYDECYAQLDELLGDEVKKNEVSLISLFESRPDLLEKVVFKNESDLQQSLNDLLPPREVFLSTNFLLQDADNIFELQPADRLTVLKNIFWLLGIDDAKTILSDKRRELQTKLKIHSDTSTYDAKLHHYLSTIITHYDELLRQIETDWLLSWLTAFIDEYRDLVEKIAMTHMSLESADEQRYEPIHHHIESRKAEYHKADSVVQWLQQQVNQLQQTISQTQQQIDQTNREIKQYEQQIARVDQHKINELKSQKKQYIDEREKIVATIPVSLCEWFIDERSTLCEWHEQIDQFSRPESRSINHLDQLIQFCITQGKFLKQERTTLERDQEQFLNQQKQYNERLLKLDEKIEQASATLDQESRFHCEKIASDCPFISQINQKTVRHLTDQQQQLTTERQDIHKEIDQQAFATKLTDNEKQRTFTEKLINYLSDFLQKLDWQQRQQTSRDVVHKQHQADQTDKQIMQLEEAAGSLETIKQQLHTAQWVLQQKEKEYHTHQQSLSWLQSQLTEKQQTRDSLHHDRLVQFEQTAHQLRDQIQIVERLITDFKDIQLTIKSLKEQETVVHNLYQIFSKELLLVVLQDSLPVLADILNAYLSQVVDYTVSMQIIQKDNDSVELEAMIIDDKGERAIKSLSGGQRVVLKLSWMLAVSSFMQAKMLFLDETINNLDHDTVGKVADMLYNFIKQHDITFYTITHSEQIQQMSIWEKIVRV